MTVDPKGLDQTNHRIFYEVWDTNGMGDLISLLTDLSTQLPKWHERASFSLCFLDLSQDLQYCRV